MFLSHSFLDRYQVAKSQGNARLHDQLKDTVDQLYDLVQTEILTNHPEALNSQQALRELMASLESEKPGGGQEVKREPFLMANLKKPFDDDDGEKIARKMLKKSSFKAAPQRAVKVRKPSQRAVWWKERMRREQLHKYQVNPALRPITFRFKTISIECYMLKCRRTFASKPAMERHLKDKHRMKKYRCWAIGCTANYSDRFALESHYGVGHPSLKTWRCTFCAASFVSPGALSQHVFYRHIRGQFACIKAGCIFSCEYRCLMLDHINFEHGPNLRPQFVEPSVLAKLHRGPGHHSMS